MSIELKNLGFQYGNLEIIKDLSLSIRRGRVTVLLGPSGCGKTTLLNLISGNLKPNSGIVEVPKNIKFSYIFQESRLLPWKNVEDNIKFVLESLPNKEKDQKIKHLLSELELIDFRNYYPCQLSGGMKQRVAIARAFAYPSNTILMDEPFKGLDITLKFKLFELFNKVWRKEQRTAIFVTHDIQEAIQLGDDIILLTQKPVLVKKQYINPLPYNKRQLHNSEILTLEKELYKLII